MENESFRSLPSLISLAKDMPGPVIAEIIKSTETSIKSSLIAKKDSESVKSE